MWPKPWHCHLYIVPHIHALGTHLNTKVVPAKLFRCSNESGRNEKVRSPFPPQPTLAIHDRKICCLLAEGRPTGTFVSHIVAREKVGFKNIFC